MSWVWHVHLSTIWRMVEEVHKGGKSEHVYISLGSNLGDRAGILAIAIKCITQSKCTLISKSPIYETAPWGMNSELWFLNQVIEVTTIISPANLMSYLLQIENDLGRERGKSFSYMDRAIDLDILFYGKKIVNSSQLQIPHPKISDRLFILKPFLDLNPNFIHPKTSLSIKAHYDKCGDKTLIKEWR